MSQPEILFVEIQKYTQLFPNPYFGTIEFFICLFFIVAKKPTKSFAAHILHYNFSKVIFHCYKTAFTYSNLYESHQKVN